MTYEPNYYTVIRYMSKCKSQILKCEHLTWTALAVRCFQFINLSILVGAHHTHKLQIHKYNRREVKEQNVEITIYSIILYSLEYHSKCYIQLYIIKRDGAVQYCPLQCAQSVKQCEVLSWVLHVSSPLSEANKMPCCLCRWADLLFSLSQGKVRYLQKTFFFK